MQSKKKLKYDQLKIWLLISNRWNSAISEYALSLARGLAKIGYSTVLTSKKSSPVARRAEAMGISLMPVDHFSISQLKNLLRIKGAIAPDVIVTFGGPESALCQLYLGQGGAKVVRFRGDNRDLTPPHPVKRIVQGMGIDAVVFPSKMLRSQYGEQRSWVTPLGVDGAKFRLIPEMSKGERPEVVIIGRLDPVKGHGGFFPIFKDILLKWGEKTSLPILKIVGQEANLLVESVKKMAEQAGLQESRDFIIESRRFEQIENLMNKASLGVIPSIDSEVICRVAEEFLMCGTRILVNTVGSLPEALFEGGGKAMKISEMQHHIPLIISLIKDGFRNCPEDREKIASEARRRYCLHQMGKSFKQGLIACVN